MEKSNSMRLSFSKFLGRLFSKPAVYPSVMESVGGKGHYFDGNGSAGYNYRSSQSKRRKMARRTNKFA